MAQVVTDRAPRARAAASTWLMVCALGLLAVTAVRYLYYDLLLYEQFVRMVGGD
jgi:hypothetical protein